MEKTIYEQAIVRLTSAEAIAYIEGAGQVRLQDSGWYEQQIEDVLKDKDVQSYPFNCPAVFFQFTPTRYEKASHHYWRSTQSPRTPRSCPFWSSGRPARKQWGPRQR